LDARRLYLGQGCSSMFTYCTQVLNLAEHAAFNRIEAARVARRFPIIFELLADGRIHLSAVRLLAPHLTEATISRSFSRHRTRASAKSSRWLRVSCHDRMCRHPCANCLREQCLNPRFRHRPRKLLQLERMGSLSSPRPRHNDQKRSHSPRGDSESSSQWEKRPI
jgi:hypothetical protein